MRMNAKWLLVVGLFSIQTSVYAHVIKTELLAHDESISHFRVEGTIDSNQLHTHILPDPWASTSEIVEFTEPQKDALYVEWSIQHTTGPHMTDVNPNDLAFLALGYIADAPGTFSRTITKEIAHAADPHIDSFTLTLTGTIDDMLRITEYKVDYLAQHIVPLPAAVWLLGSGFLGLILVARRRSA